MTITSTRRMKKRKCCGLRHFFIAYFRPCVQSPLRSRRNFLTHRKILGRGTPSELIDTPDHELNQQQRRRNGEERRRSLLNCLISFNNLRQTILVPLSIKGGSSLSYHRDLRTANQAAVAAEWSKVASIPIV